ncbi:permease prefix domain 1-containing protein [Deinococcus lacus]|uniref:Permease prefix domain 1-containing protein n=1 Tax=Deinococcus lacus TaxID=392561 RepID=A0ABW1YCE4_9DEIO
MSRVLSGYIHRATLGLPQEERREVAAELRTHLLERVRQLEAEGFEREEAEHLAVKAMGDVKATNSELLGHFFTTPLGWAVLAALVLGGGSYWLWRTVPLPLLRQPSVRWEEKLTADDLAFLMEQETAPRMGYNALTLSIPPKTPWLYTALLPRTGAGLAELQIIPIAAAPQAPEAATHSPNASYQARFLLSGAAWKGNPCEAVKGQPQVQVFAALRPLTPENPIGMSSTGGCTGLSLPKEEKVGVWSLGWMRLHPDPQKLKLNEWTVLATYGVDVRTEGSDPAAPGSHYNYLLAVMPADRRLDQPDPAEPKETPNHRTHIMLDGPNWDKYARGLPRPSLKQP